MGVGIEDRRWLVRRAFGGVGLLRLARLLEPEQPLESVYGVIGDDQPLLFGPGFSRFFGRCFTVLMIHSRR